MRTSYKTLTNDEYNVLNKIVRKTKMDCWFEIRQDSLGTDYVWDLEERKRFCLRTGVAMLVEGLDCQENYDNCWLTDDEDKTFRDLLYNLDLKLEW